MFCLIHDGDGFGVPTQRQNSWLSGLATTVREASAGRGLTELSELFNPPVYRYFYKRIFTPFLSKTQSPPIFHGMPLRSNTQLIGFHSVIRVPSGANKQDRKWGTETK